MLLFSPPVLPRPLQDEEGRDVYYVPAGALQGQKRALYLWELQRQAAVSTHGVLGTEHRSSEMAPAISLLAKNIIQYKILTKQDRMLSLP